MHYHDRSIRPTVAPAAPEPRRFTAREYLAMDSAGILHPQERVELIDGEIVAMPAKSARHDDASQLLDDLVTRRLDASTAVGQEVTLRLSETYYPGPDLFLFPRGLRVSQVRGDTVLLVVEIAVSSLSFDLDVKAPLYAAHGVRELWVVDARRMVAHVHREPGPAGYGIVREAAATEMLSPVAVPALSLCLAELGLEPLTDEAAAAGER